MRPFTFFYVVFAIFFAVVGAREDRTARLKRQLATRQNQNTTPFTGPTTVTTTRTAETFAGTVIETCTIKLTPITVNGQNAVQEERNCTTQLVKSSSTVVASTSTGVSTSTIQPQTTSVSTVVVTATVTGTSAATTSTASASSTSVATTSASSSSAAVTSTSSSSASQSTTKSLATSTSAASSTSSPVSSSTSSSASPAVTSAVSSSVSSAASSTSTSAAASSTVTSAASSTTAAGGPAKEIGMETKSVSSLPPATTTPAAVSVSTTATATSATTSVSAAAAEASASATPFTLPGKKLEVLPIGLGVFAGISVIALIVVGLVTYERTKYRKAFRQRKLAEQGAGMGYSGMSERV